MRQNKEDTVKGVLPKLLVRAGVAPTEKNLFKTRIAIVLVCLLGIIYFYSIDGGGGEKYGNYDEIKQQLP